MKKITGLLLSSLSILAVSLNAQAEQYSNRNYELAKDQKSIQKSDAEFEYIRTNSRATNCVDTSWYPRINADTLYTYPMSPAGSGDYAVGQLYLNTTSATINAVTFWTNTLASGISAKAQVWNVANGMPTTLIEETTSSDLAAAADHTIEFANGVEVTGDFMISVAFEDKADTNTISIVFDPNSGSGLGHLRLTSNDAWLKVSPEGIDAQFGGGAATYAGTDYQMMLFPIFSTSLEASYTADATLSSVEEGTTVTFTSSVNAPTLADSMLVYTYGSGRPSNYSWFNVDPTDTTIIENIDDEANYSYTFSTTGEYWVDLWAVQASWSAIWTGQYAQCQDIYSQVVTVTEAQATGIDQFEENKVTVFPNPATNAVAIDFNAADESLTLEVYDNAGQRVHHFQSGNLDGGQRFIVDTHNWASGNYFYKVAGAQTNFNGKCVVKK